MKNVDTSAYRVILLLTIVQIIPRIYNLALHNWQTKEFLVLYRDNAYLSPHQYLTDFLACLGTNVNTLGLPTCD